MQLLFRPFRSFTEFRIFKLARIIVLLFPLFLTSGCKQTAGMVARKNVKSSNDSQTDNVSHQNEVEEIPAQTPGEEEGNCTQTISGIVCGNLPLISPPNVDVDQDGVVAELDCDDGNPDKFKNHFYTSIDEDGDGAFRKASGVICAGEELPGSYSKKTNFLEDCDDNDAEKHRGATLYPDFDGDGYGEGLVSKFHCIGENLPELWSEDNTDCDPSDNNKYRNIAYSYIDFDRDGYSIAVSGEYCGGDSLEGTNYSVSAEAIDCNDLDPTLTYDCDLMDKDYSQEAPVVKFFNSDTFYQYDADFIVVNVRNIPEYAQLGYEEPAISLINGKVYGQIDVEETVIGELPIEDFFRLRRQLDESFVSYEKHYYVNRELITPPTNGISSTYYDPGYAGIRSLSAPWNLIPISGTEGRIYNSSPFYVSNIKDILFELVLKATVPEALEHNNLLVDMGYGSQTFGQATKIRINSYIEDFNTGLDLDLFTGIITTENSGRIVGEVPAYKLLYAKGLIAQSIVTHEFSEIIDGQIVTPENAGEDEQTETNVMGHFSFFTATEEFCIGGLGPNYNLILRDRKKLYKKSLTFRFRDIFVSSLY